MQKSNSDIVGENPSEGSEGSIDRGAAGGTNVIKDTAGDGASGIDPSAPVKKRGRPTIYANDEEKRRARREREAGRIGNAPSSERPTASGKKRGNDALKFGLAPGLQFAHVAAANFSGLPFLEIEKSEAEQLATAAADVFAQYDMQVSPVVTAWINLFTVSSAIYAPRFLMYKAHQKELRDRELARASAPAENTLQ